MGMPLSREKNTRFFWSGLAADQHSLYGVGFANHNKISPVQSASIPAGVSERYAPTLGTSQDVKDSFYEDLANIAGGTRKVYPFFILRDLNARVGNHWNYWWDIMGLAR